MPRQTARRPAPARPTPAPQRSHAPPPPPQQTAPVPHQTHAAAQVQPPPPPQPSLFKQMAATAGGVAVGSAVGHAVGHALTGAFSGGSTENAQAAATSTTAAAAGTDQQKVDNPCAFELDQFLQCTQNQSDLAMCEGFNEALKACKRTHSTPQSPGSQQGFVYGL